MQYTVFVLIGLGVVQFSEEKRWLHTKIGQILNNYLHVKAIIESNFCISETNNILF